MKDYKMFPLVSVIMPTRDRAFFVESAIKSVLLQTISHIEFVIVDDASSDGTIEILNAYARDDARIKIIRNCIAQGGSRARNLGIDVASGIWIAFIDDDDEWEPHKLERQIAVLRDNPTSVACSCYFKQYFPSGKTKIIKPLNSPSLESLLCNNVLGGASMCMCSSEILKLIKGFDTFLTSCQDWDLWVRLHEYGDILVCNEVLVRYAAHNGPRISNNMPAQYLGSRRFYFKHRNKMSINTKIFRIANIAYMMSRQEERRFTYRAKLLIISVKYSNFLTAVRYVFSSLPRLIFQVFLSSKIKFDR